MCSSRIFFIFTFSLVLVSIEASDPDSSTNADTKKYNPLYVVFENYKYSLVDSIKYNSVLKNHNYETSEDKVKMLAACPKKDTPIDEALLEIMPVDEKTLDVDGYKCDSPGTFFTKQKTHGEHIVIGFMVGAPDKVILVMIGLGEVDEKDYMIYDKNNHSGHIGILPGTPWNHFPIPLIKIAYKQFVNRSITSWHEINFSDILPLDEDPDQQLLNNSVYEKDVEFYGYDIDPAYKEKNQSRFVREFFKKESQSRLVKLQLAPSADFYFDEWKSATRIFGNINTTPIWQELVEEWKQLERFIRQISKVLGELHIVTGGYPPATTTHPDDDEMSILLPFYENPNKRAQERIPVPMFLNLYKAVVFTQKRAEENAEEKLIRYGILFELKNDPRAKAHEFNEIAVKNGWNYLGKQNKKSETRFNVYELNGDTFKKMNVYHGEVYRPFDLNEVIKLWRDEKNQEFERKVDVLEEMGLKEKSIGGALDKTTNA